MKCYAVFSKTHGLKTMQARSLKRVALQWEMNSGGVPAEWIARYPARRHGEVKQMMRFGWTGTCGAFTAMLRD